jgi:hypothetical protein
MRVNNPEAAYCLSLVRESATLLPGIGEVEAHAVDYFFRELKAVYPSPPTPSPRYSSALLWGYAGVLRLARLEAAGIDRHLRTGLPNTRTSLIYVTDACTLLSDHERDQTVARFVAKVILETSESFSLEGRDLLGADILVGDAHEDVLLDQLAHYLWAHRHHAGETHGRSNS